MAMHSWSGLVVGCLVGILTFSSFDSPGSRAAAAEGEADETPRELGQIEWIRGFDRGIDRAKLLDRPLLVLFQEVPGCHTCVTYGDKVLSHPLIVDAAEQLFVPVAVYNNITGDDERVLNSFKEPSWNNPVVRIIDTDRKELATRLADDYSVGGLANAMVTALQKAGQGVPPYLELLAAEETQQDNFERATFAMHCFWVGEATLGKMPGVVLTEPGFLDGQEVVEVTFDPSKLSYEALLKLAQKQQCATTVYTRSDAQQSTAGNILGDSAVRTDDTIRPDSQPKYYLAQSELRFVPMTSAQASKVNAAIGGKGNPAFFLAQNQRQLWTLVKRHPDAGWPVALGNDDLVSAWRAAKAAAAQFQKAGL